MMLNITPPNRIIASTDSFTVQGAGFRQVSYSVSARIGGSTAEATSWFSDTTLHLRPTVVTIGSNKLMVTAGAVASTLTDAFFFDPILLSSIGNANITPSNTASTGSVSIVLFGGGIPGKPQGIESA